MQCRANCSYLMRRLLIVHYSLVCLQLMKAKRLVETSVMIYCESFGWNQKVIICIIICMHVCHTSCTDAKSCHRHRILGGAPKLFISMLHNNYQLFLIYQSDHQYNNYIHTSELNVTTIAIVKLMHVHDSCSCL